MSDADLQREAQFAELLARYEEGLSGETPRRAVDSSVIASEIEMGVELAAELNGAIACLELLDRVRRHWSPIGDEDTPAPWLTAALATPSPGGMTALGRFRIVRELGRGGLGMVYLAYDPQLGRHVALKVPRPEALANPDLRRRFLREAKAAARLSHPNLVTVHEAGEAGPICYIAAEFCPGPTLRDWLREQPGAVDIGLAARLTMQLALGVQHAHGRGVLHRDIKPSNVMVGRLEAAGGRPEEDNTSKSPHPGPLPQGEREKTSRQEGSPADDGLCPKLTDFGMAKLLERAGDETHSGAIIGTPAYMAPEQAQGRVDELDARTDIYALGAILYELLTFRRAHGGRTELEALRGVLFEEPPAPRTLRREIPRDLEAIALKCLAKRPDDRYATAQQLADDLARFLAGEPTAARPLGPVARLGKWARRRPALAALLGVLAVSLLALFGTVVGYNARLSDEVARADSAREIAQREAEASRRLLYSGDVRLAFESFKANHIVQALELLNRHVPRPGQEDLREFAWYYLRDQCQPAVLTLTGHEQPVMTVAFSPDGRTIATGSEDGTARLWDTSTGELLHTLRDDTTEVDCVAFSPDGRVLAAGNVNHAVRLWDPKTGAMGRALAGHTDHVLAVAFSPNGRWLASGSRDTTVRIWDLAQGATIKTLAGEMDVIRAAAFSPTGDLLYAVDEAERLHVWRTEDWERLPGATISHEKFFALAISRTGLHVAAAGRRESISIWESRDGELKPLEDLKDGHIEWIQSLSYSPVDDMLASGGKDNVIRLWKAGEPRFCRTLLGHADRVWSVAWSPDGRRLASASVDKTVKIWKIVGNSSDRYPALAGRVSDAKFLTDSATLLTGCSDGTVRVWDAAAHSLRSTIPTRHREVREICISSDDLLIATRGEDRTTVVLHRETQKELLALPRSGMPGVALAWAPRSHRLAKGIDDTTILIVDIDTGEVEGRFEHATRLHSAAFTPDGRRLVTTSQTLQIWDVETGRRICELPQPCNELAIAADRNMLAASPGSQVELLDPQTGRRLSTLVTMAAEIERVAFDGPTLAVACKEPSAIGLWDTRTSQLLATLDVDAEQILGLTFSPDGRRLLATGKDTAGKGRIWEWTIRKER